MSQHEKFAKLLNENIDNLLLLIIEKKVLELSQSNFEVKEENTKILDDSIDVLKHIFNKEENIRKFNQNYYFEKRIFELLIFEHTNLFFLLSRSVWGDEIEIGLNEKDKIRFRHLTMLLNNQINNLKSILLQLENGLTQTSDIVFRNYMEISEKSLAILIDEDYFNLYKTETNNKQEEMKVWSKTKPSKTFHIVQKRLLKLDNIEFHKAFFEIRKSLYERTSKAVHAEISSTTTESINFNTSEYIKWSISGKTDERIREVLKEYLLYIKVISRSFLILLVADYKISMNKFGDDGIYHTLINQITEEAFNIYMKKNYV